MGSIEVKLNWIVGFLFVFLALVVIITAVVSGTLQGVKSDGQWYMGSKRLVSGVRTTFIGLGTFLVLFSTWIPISLFVTLEYVTVSLGVCWAWEAALERVVPELTLLRRAA